MSDRFTIRRATEADAHAIVDTLTAAILGLTQGHYDDAQRKAWAPVPEEFGNWLHRLASLETLLAEGPGSDAADGDAPGAAGKVLGFLSFVVTPLGGHVDLLFTAPDAARQGVATALYAQAERDLAARGVTRLCTEASLVSQPFFARQGFVVDEVQDVERRGVVLRRHAMSKRLDRTV